MDQSTMLEQNKVNDDLKLQITRVIKANRTRVFDAWTRPEMMRQWFAPGNMIVPNASNDLREGGTYQVEMRGSIAACEGSTEDVDMSHSATVTGVYKEIIPNELLSFTWQGNWEPREETLVTVRFKDVAGGTEVTLIHERFTTAESTAKHQHGWNGCFDKLAKFFEK